jgi:hypothetical protein
MKRRTFIASLATAPLFVRRAFGDASVGGAPRAATSARPTLVFVVPTNAEKRSERGLAYGEVLVGGSDAELAPLALVDVVCAPAADYGVAGDPVMLYVAGQRVRVLDGKWPKSEPAQVALIHRLISEVAPLHDTDRTSLAAAARQRYLKKAPRGARWGHTTMCGNEYDEGPADNVDCGMGHLSEPSRRFLDFYAKLR